MMRDKKKKGCIRGKRGEVWLFKKNPSDTIDKKPTNHSLYNQNIFCSSELLPLLICLSNKDWLCYNKRVSYKNHKVNKEELWIQKI